MTIKTVLITGVTGFIGRYVARVYSDLGWKVVGTGTTSEENSPTGNLSLYRTLFLPSPELPTFIEQIRPQVCVHCAGRASVPLSVNEPADDFNASVASTFNLLEALRKKSPECRLIYLSSAAVYGNPQILPVSEDHSSNPISPYGFHKSICEELCKEFYEIYNLHTTVLRIFSAYGPGLRRQVVWDICYKALTQPILQLQGTGQESRDFIHVRDVARAIYFLSENSSAWGRIFNVASGQETTIQKLAELVMEYLNKQNAITFDGNIPKGTPMNWRADMSRLEKLGFSSEVSLEKGIEVYTKWCQAEIIGW
jgi:UDP-glucose 4-epimerase